MLLQRLNNYRMKQVTITLYELDELSEASRISAIESLRSINVEHDWWDSLYEDALSVGLKLTGFDLDYMNISGDFIWPSDIVCNAIIKDHGDTTSTYLIASRYIGGDDKVLLDALLRDYLHLLNEEYYYLIGDDAVAEAIRANEYWFTEDGKLFRE